MTIQVSIQMVMTSKSRVYTTVVLQQCFTKSVSSNFDIQSSSHPWRLFKISLIPASLADWLYSLS